MKRQRAYGTIEHRNFRYRNRIFTYFFITSLYPDITNKKNSIKQNSFHDMNITLLKHVNKNIII